jgi:hypothetical protein
LFEPDVVAFFVAAPALALGVDPDAAVFFLGGMDGIWKKPKTGYW